MRTLALTCLTVALLASFAFSEEPISGSGGASSGNLSQSSSSSGGNLTLSVSINGSVDPGKRGFCYATRSTLLNKGFAFFILFDTSITSHELADYPYSTCVGDERGSVVQSVKVGESEAKFSYAVTAVSLAKVEESLTIRGKKVDLAKGRVFICSLEKDSLQIKQVQEFPVRGVSSAEAEVILEKLKTALDAEKLKTETLE